MYVYIRILDSRHPSPPQDYVPHAKAFGKYFIFTVSIHTNLMTIRIANELWRPQSISYEEVCGSLPI